MMMMHWCYAWRECTDAFAFSSHIGQSRVLVQWTKVVMVKMSLAAYHALCFKVVCLLCCQTQRLAAGYTACHAGILGRLLLPEQ